MVALARKTATLTVLGNHDVALAGLCDETFEEARNPVLLADIRGVLPARDLGWLRHLQVTAVRHGIELVHATLNDPLATISTPYDADCQLALADERILLVGHHHRAFVYSDSTGWLDLPGEGTVIAIPPDEQTLICPGAIATSPDSEHGSLVIIDLTERTVEWSAVRPPAPSVSPRE